MKDLIAQPDVADEGDKRERHDAQPAPAVHEEIVGGKHVQRKGEEGADRAGEQAAVDAAGSERHDAQPSEQDEGVVQPEAEAAENGGKNTSDQNAKGKAPGHVRGVDGREFEAVGAQLAVLLLAVIQPLDKAAKQTGMKTARWQRQREIKQAYHS